MAQNEEKKGVLPQIIVAVVVALLVGGTAPWWWKEIFHKPPQDSAPVSPRPPQVQGVPMRDRRANPNPNHSQTTTLPPHGNDIIDLQVLTEMPDKLVVRIDYHYSGNWGSAGWLSAQAINTWEPDRNFTYYDMIDHSVNNAAKIGRNSMDMRLIGTQGTTQNFQFRTDAIEVCLFNGLGPGKHCETFPYGKQWSL